MLHTRFFKYVMRCARKARAWRGHGGLAIVLWGTLLGHNAFAQNAPLWLVQPMDRTPVGNAVALHFAHWLPHYLGEKAVVHRPSNGQGLDGIAWAAQSASPERTLVLMSLVWMSRLEALPAATPGARGWVPLQMVLLGSWCLMAPKAQALPDFPALQRWLRALHRPVRLAIPHNFGAPELWVQAMARKTELPWQAVAFGAARQSIQALQAGQVDLVLDRCGDTARYLDAERAGRGSRGGPPVQVLARVGAPTALTAPTFTQWQLPSLAPGWAAWFVRADMSTARQATLAEALHAILLRDDTQALIASQQQQPVRMGPTDSQRFVRRSLAQGHSLRQWLEQSADPLADMEPLVR